MRANLLLASVLFLPALAQADPKPAHLFSDHMVLQSGMSVPIWGTADPAEKITITFNGQTKSVVTAPDGKWQVRLADLKPGGPFEMTIAGHSSLTIKDILVGEVWLASGQSNMAFTISKAHASYAGILDEEKEIAAANFPEVRMFTGKETKSYEPQSDIAGEWRVCSPATVGDFSAVGYLFARNLNQALKLPVGIITEAYGASTAEAWIPRETLAADPQLAPMLAKFDARYNYFKANPGVSDADAPPAPQTINARPGKPGPLRDPVQDQHQPTVLYNGMIAPVLPYAIRGAIWYQGESVTGGARGVELYAHVMETLVTEWRKRWAEGNFPFYAVQLAPQKNVSNNPYIREQQAKILSLPNTGLAITLDIGDPTNVHPKNKEPLGDRLTRIALANVYGKKIEFSGPVYQSMSIEGDKIRIRFTHAAGLMAKDGPPAWFQIAGPDGTFVKAEATIEGDSILVHSPEVPNPTAVRYAWDNYPEGANLYNAAGLPAAPFRTDHLDALTPIAAEFTGK
jgi:sialate O-acetylesterase